MLKNVKEGQKRLKNVKKTLEILKKVKFKKMLKNI